MKRSRFFSAILRTCWLPFLGALPGAVVNYYRAPRDASYVSFAKLHVKDSPMAPEGYNWRGLTWPRVQMESLEGDLMHARTLESLKRTYPAWKEDMARLDSVTRTGGSSILALRATGMDAASAQAYLAALIDVNDALVKDGVVDATMKSSWTVILQRPSPAVKWNLPVRQSIFKGAIMGGSIGFMLMLLRARVLLTASQRKIRLPQ